MKSCIDALPSISISPLRASGIVKDGQEMVRVSLEGVSRFVRLTHRHLLHGGGWSFFRCPECGRRARVLRLHDGRFKCRYCVGLPYRCQQHDKGPRIERLRAKLSGKPLRVKPRPYRLLDRRRRIERALRKALVAERMWLRGWGQ